MKSRKVRTAVVTIIAAALTMLVGKLGFDLDPEIVIAVAGSIVAMGWKVIDGVTTEDVAAIAVGTHRSQEKASTLFKKRPER